MGDETSEGEENKDFNGYQINDDLLKVAKERCE